jgi:hypothetical protein
MDSHNTTGSQNALESNFFYISLAIVLTMALLGIVNDIVAR